MIVMRPPIDPRLIAPWTAAEEALSKMREQQSRHMLEALDDAELVKLSDAVMDWPPEPDGFVPFAGLVVEIRKLRSREKRRARRWRLQDERR